MRRNGRKYSEEVCECRGGDDHKGLAYLLLIAEKQIKTARNWRAVIKINKDIRISILIAFRNTKYFLKDFSLL